jgi:DNA-binding Xre family transcriptional regulator
MKIEINLWELLGKNKMTARDLSKISWLTPVQISNIKNGKTKKIELQTIAKLLQAFECTPNDLFKIKNE